MRAARPSRSSSVTRRPGRSALANTPAGSPHRRHAVPRGVTASWRRTPTGDASTRPLGHTARLPARAGDPVHRLRRLPQPRLTAHLQRRLPRPPARLLGIPLLRHKQPLTALPVGDVVRRPASRLHGRPAAGALERPGSATATSRHWPCARLSARSASSPAAAPPSATACPVCSFVAVGAGVVAGGSPATRRPCIRAGAALPIGRAARDSMSATTS